MLRTYYIYECAKCGDKLRKDEQETRKGVSMGLLQFTWIQNEKKGTTTTMKAMKALDHIVPN